MPRSVCIHAHFYQPPRENPWLEAIDLQSSARPFHDWNQRVTAECYSPNTAARIVDNENRIIKIINNYERMSFNFGPTLLSWLEVHDPQTYQTIIRSDRRGQERFGGHGPALAQCYNHIIMPLATRRDKETQVIWGLRDFEFRFGRKAEGIWLPETGVDLETLEILAEQGIKFTILAPSQCKRVREIGKRRWQETGGVDPRRSYLCHLPSGKSIVIFFYDGPISRDVAFGDLLRNGENLVNRLLSIFNETAESELSHIATDGETYGHHHKMGDMALAYSLDHLFDHKNIDLTVYGQFLEKNPPAWEAEIIERSSWSCSHGIERWRDNCGCRISHQEWSQNWRAPLRGALDWLRDELTVIFEEKGNELLKDIWASRNDYIEVILNRSDTAVERFFDRNALKTLSETEKIRVLKLMEMMRQAMLMYTSCGWFFDEISGIETVQILQYAARAIQLAGDLSGQDLEKHFIRLLAAAPSNLPEYRDGATIYEKLVRPQIFNLMHIGAHYAAAAVFTDPQERAQLYCYQVELRSFERFDMEEKRLVVGRARIRSSIVREERTFAFATLHLGDQDLLCGIDEFSDDKIFAAIKDELIANFRRNDSISVLRQIETDFHHTQYSLKDLFKDEQRKLLYKVLDQNLEGLQAPLKAINAHRAPIMSVARELNVPLPKVLGNAVSLMFDTDIIHALSENPPAFDRLRELIREVKELSLEIDQETLSVLVRRKIEELMSLFEKNPDENELLTVINSIFSVLEPLNLAVDLWKPQNIYFSLRGNYLPQMEQKALNGGDPEARDWITGFHALGRYLQVAVEMPVDSQASQSTPL